MAPVSQGPRPLRSTLKGFDIWWRSTVKLGTCAVRQRTGAVESQCRGYGVNLTIARTCLGTISLSRPAERTGFGIRRRALAFVARGRGVTSPAHGAEKQGAAKRRARPSASGANSTPLGGPAGGSSKRDHRGRHMTSKAGEPICFVYNNSTGCKEPCPNGRVHVCHCVLVCILLLLGPKKGLGAKKSTKPDASPSASPGVLLDPGEAGASLQVTSLGVLLDPREAVASSMVHVGKFANCLVRKDLVDEMRCKKLKCSEVGLLDGASGEWCGKLAVPIRGAEAEEVKAIGGLRDTARAVAKLPVLRVAGQQLRAALEELIAKCVSWQSEVSTACARLGSKNGGFSEELISNVKGIRLDAKKLRPRCGCGGVAQTRCPTETCGVFPPSDGPSAAILASQAFWEECCLGQVCSSNYKSFEDGGLHAVKEVSRLEACGFADLFPTWEQVIALWPNAVVEAWWRFMRGQGRPLVAEEVLPLFMVCDFADAFMSIPLLHKDRGFAVIAVPSGFLVYRRLAFGIAPAPLLWGRVASVYCRLAQSICESWEARFRAYLDDPLLTLAAPTSRASHLGGLVLLLWCSLGLSLSWEKGSFGRQFLMDSDGLPAVRVVLADKKHQEMLVALDFLLQARGMVDLAVVRRPGHLFPVNRIYQPLRWIKAVFEGVALQLSLGIARSIRPRLGPVEYAIQTDACPAGLGPSLGAILYRWHKPCQWLADIIHDVDLVRFGTTKGDPAWQSTWELLALLVDLQVWGPKLQASGTCELQTDSKAALDAACAMGARLMHSLGLLCLQRSPVLGRFALRQGTIPFIRRGQRTCALRLRTKGCPPLVWLLCSARPCLAVLSVAQPAARMWAAHLQQDGGAGWARLPKRVRKPAKQRQSESDDRASVGMRACGHGRLTHGRPSTAGGRPDFTGEALGLAYLPPQGANKGQTTDVSVGQGRPDFTGEAEVELSSSSSE
eukprot:5576000-Amphidinium_carterae.1